MSERGGGSHGPGPGKYALDSPPTTRHLYMVDEVLSALQKAVRRSLHDAALFWTLELVRSGLGALALMRFGVMVSEDISLGGPTTPGYMLQVRVLVLVLVLVLVQPRCLPLGVSTWGAGCAARAAQSRPRERIAPAGSCHHV